MSQDLYTLSLDSIKYVLGLISATVDLPNTILDDLNIQTTTTYSSYRLDTLLKALKDENIKYCDEAIAGLNKLSKEIVDDSSKVVKENTIYLILTNPVNNVYEQWLLINGTPQMIGTTEMNLDSVYTKQEADARYTLLTDFNTLKTKVDGKVNKTDIVDNLTSTDTDKPLSANQGKVLNDGKVDKTELAGLKRRYNSIEELNAIKKKSLTLVNREDNTQKVLDALDAGEVLSDYFSNVENTSRFGISSSLGTYFIITFEKNGNGYAKITANSTSSDTMLVRYHNANELGAWRRVYTTSVADVPITYINTFENETYVKPTNTNVCSYQVINGICVIRLETYCMASTTQEFVQIFSGLPKPTNELFSNTIDRNMETNSGARGIFNLLTNGTLRVVCDYGESPTGGVRYFYATFSYPVKES